MRLIFLAFLPLLALAQPESDPLCGTTILRDLVLDHNITCYNTNGLIVGAEGLTIDLNGNKIICSNGNSLGCEERGLTGIDASGVRTVSIKGPGSVRGFHLSMKVAGSKMAAVQPGSRIVAARRVRLKSRLD